MEPLKDTFYFILIIIRTIFFFEFIYLFLFDLIVNVVFRLQLVGVEDIQIRDVDPYQSSRGATNSIGINKQHCLFA